MPLPVFVGQDLNFKEDVIHTFAKDRTERAKVLISDLLRQCRLALLRLHVEICPFFSEGFYQCSGC